MPGGMAVLYHSGAGPVGRMPPSTAGRMPASTGRDWPVSRRRGGAQSITLPNRGYGKAGKALHYAPGHRPDAPASAVLYALPAASPVFVVALVWL